MPDWEPTEIKLTDSDLADYEATRDWFAFDCVCMDTKAENYENLPYDLQLHDLAPQRFTCPRCGRIYRLKLRIEAEVYTPLAIKYPNVKDRMPPETLGLRDREA